MLRIFVGLLGLGALASTAALMLSDRAPGVLVTVFGDSARRLSARIDARAEATIGSEVSLPETDMLVHVSLWALVVVLVGFTVWSWRGLVVAATSLLAISISIELAQSVLSSTRTVEPRDIVSNTVGVIAGTLVVAVGYGAWSACARLVRGLS